MASVRLAVRRSLAELADGSLVLAACSGGADSLALAAALAFEAPRLGLRAGAVTVDHGLQEGSASQAERVAATARDLGLDPVCSVAARVADRGSDRYHGPEAAARQARYEALDASAAACGASAILLGHTMDDQAETVLLGLARGSGARSIAGMAPTTLRPLGETLCRPGDTPEPPTARDPPADDTGATSLPGNTVSYLRPLLGLRRGQTRAACAALGLHWWDDPQNADPAFARTRVREQILPLMEELIGPGVAEALARTADQLRADADLLDSQTATHADELMRDWQRDGAARALDVDQIAGLPDAIRTRLLLRAAIAAGAPAGAVTARHVAWLDALVMDWHGQRWVDLPGGLRCQRQHGKLHFIAEL